MPYPCPTATIPSRPRPSWRRAGRRLKCVRFMYTSVIRAVNERTRKTTYAHIRFPRRDRSNRRVDSGTVPRLEITTPNTLASSFPLKSFPINFSTQPAISSLEEYLATLALCTSSSFNNLVAEQICGSKMRISFLFLLRLTRSGLSHELPIGIMGSLIVRLPLRASVS